MSYWIAALIVIPGLLLYIKQSSYLVDYLIWVTAFNRGMRRVVDWMGGAFNPFDVISITPLAIGCLILLVVIQKKALIPQRVRVPLLWVGGALIYAFMVGLILNKLAAVYALAEYVVPLGVMLFAFLWGRNDAVMDRWMRTIMIVGVAVAIYGWYQYYVIPPWDAMWVRAVGFEGYLGNLAPTEMTVFSTLNERGPCATFLALAVMPPLMAKRWRRWWSWPAIAIIIPIILLTYVRTALVAIGLILMLHPFLNRGRGFGRSGLLIGALVLLGPFALTKLPGYGSVDKRLESFADLKDDSSFQGRIGIMKASIRETVAFPTGFGLGGVGTAGRINSGSIEGSELASDGGYNQVLVSFGLFGAPMFFFGMWALLKEVLSLEKAGLASEETAAMKTTFGMLAITFYIGNLLIGTVSIMFWLLLGHALEPAIRPRLASWRKIECIHGPQARLAPRNR